MIDLKSNAEQEALKAAKLPSFENLALLGLKKRVAEMLDAIGRTSEIFATYTKHDISHIDAMLKHLDWVIPPSTRSEMTSIDWLLITLAIYLHDLGMLVTHEEYENRTQNDFYILFLQRLKTDSKGQEYIGRAQKMSHEEQERFFFQEFIRETHAERIKEWVTGRHTRRWSSSTEAITTEVSDMMRTLPSRFRENLALVCESHHKDNLNRIDLYPLCQGYGNDPQEVANVQYAALLLRTVDLIHVTKDRTPSIMYKTIRLSDPKGVDEWDKQKDTFAVRQKGRSFDPSDASTHTIVVSADFTEERPFFSLTEYLSWADAEIKQTKRWCDQSRSSKDGENFWFPWHAIQGDLRVEGNEPQQMRFEFDRGRLLDLLVGHAIYNDATVAVRELLQNAIDAVRFQAHLNSREAETHKSTPVPMGEVTVSWDQETRRLVIEDTGTGMDLDVIKFHLMRVGSSFYDTPQFATEHKDFTPVSRFGIGVLTCFMISDEIEIVTAKSSNGYRIRMSSVHADYLIRHLIPGDPKLANIEPHGTRVTLTIREGVDLKDKSIEQILRHWIVLPECKVNFVEKGKPATPIGYTSVDTALLSLYESSKNEISEVKDIEIRSKNREIDGGRYEMAFAVRAKGIPEKSFAQIPRSELPAVCIEGIRVSGALPGFRHNDLRGSVSAIISVRGQRRLRTTVSRSGLEEDDEYLKLGKLCGEMLMEHVTDEIERLSASTGRPLSRASTAGKWLSNDLLRLSSTPEVRSLLEEIRISLPLIVVEKIEEFSTGAAFPRTLISPQRLDMEAYFWTIESRLVDSLGIIARDLGRELSLNEFLALLAPEHTKLGHSPILPDANLFAHDVKKQHRPALAQFSRSFQQTAIRWEKKAPDTVDAVDEAFKDESFAKSYAILQQQAAEEHDSRMGMLALELIDTDVFVTNIIGDEEDVHVVQTRMGKMLANGSLVADVWLSLEQAIERSARDRHPEHLLSFMRLRFFYSRLISAAPQRGRTRVHKEFQQDWNQTTAVANTFLSELGMKESFPCSLDFLLDLKTFNASDYWRDWHRTEKK